MVPNEKKVEEFIQILAALAVSGEYVTTLVFNRARQIVNCIFEDKSKKNFINSKQIGAKLHWLQRRIGR